MRRGLISVCLLLLVSAYALAGAKSMAQRRFEVLGAADDATAVLWTPADLTDVYMWLDPADTSILYQDTGKLTNAVIGQPVRVWMPRAGAVDARVGAVATDPPTYATNADGVGCMSYTNTQNRLFTTTNTVFVTLKTPATNCAPYTIIGAYNRASAGIRSIVAGGIPDTLDGTFSFSGHWTDNKYYHNTQGKYVASVSAYTNTGMEIAIFRNTGANYAAGVSLRVNGQDLSLSAPGAQIKTFAFSSIGYSYGNNAHSGLLMDVIITTNAMSVADMPRVEGYLAHKWAMTARLPVGHPYKTSPPYKSE